MAAQQVHYVNHLATALVDLSVSTDPQEVVLLPTGAEFTHLSVEIITPADAGSLDLGYSDNGSELANDIDLTQKGVHIANVSTTISKTEKIIATTTGASRGIFKVRAGYYLPSLRPFEA